MPTNRSPVRRSVRTVHGRRGRLVTREADTSTWGHLAFLLETAGPDGVSATARVRATDVVQERIAPVGG